MLFFPSTKLHLDKETEKVYGKWCLSWDFRGEGRFVICAPYAQDGERDDEKEDKRYREWVEAMENAMGEALIETSTTRFEGD